jgi:hypothetical protein
VGGGVKVDETPRVRGGPVGSQTFGEPEVGFCEIS